MRRLAAYASFGLLLVTATAFALNDGGLDASILDGALADVVVLDSAIDAPDDGGDAAVDAAAVDAPVDAPTDAKDASSIKDAKSDVCDPNVEPCTTRADTGTDTDAGDAEEPGETGGCSCNSAPAAASTAPIVFLLAAFALMTRRRKR